MLPQIKRALLFPLKPRIALGSGFQKSFAVQSKDQRVDSTPKLRFIPVLESMQHALKTKNGSAELLDLLEEVPNMEKKNLSRSTSLLKREIIPKVLGKIAALPVDRQPKRLEQTAADRLAIRNALRAWKAVSRLHLSLGNSIGFPIVVELILRGCIAGDYATARDILALLPDRAREPTAANQLFIEWSDNLEGIELDTLLLKYTFAYTPATWTRLLRHYAHQDGARARALYLRLQQTAHWNAEVAGEYLSILVQRNAPLQEQLLAYKALRDFAVSSWSLKLARQSLVALFNAHECALALTLYQDLKAARMLDVDMFSICIFRLVRASMMSAAATVVNDLKASRLKTNRFARTSLLEYYSASGHFGQYNELLAYVKNGKQMKEIDYGIQMTHIARWPTLGSRDKRVAMLDALLSEMNTLNIPLSISGLNRLVSAMASLKQYHRIDEILDTSSRKGVPPSHETFSQLLVAYRQNRFRDPRNVIGKMAKYRLYPNRDIWNRLLDALLAAQDGPMVAKVFGEMVANNVSFDSATYSNLLNGLLDIHEPTVFVPLASTLLQHHSLQPGSLDLELLASGIDIYQQPQLARQLWSKYSQEPLHLLGAKTLSCLLSSLSSEAASQDERNHLVLNQIWDGLKQDAGLCSQMTGFLYECMISERLALQDPQGAVAFLNECLEREIVPTHRMLSKLLASPLLDPATKLDVFHALLHHQHVPQLADYENALASQTNPDHLSSLWTSFLGSGYRPTPAMITSLHPLLASDPLISSLIHLQLQLQNQDEAQSNSQRQ